jgi:hypothetical protein
LRGLAERGRSRVDGLTIAGLTDARIPHQGAEPPRRRCR